MWPACAYLRAAFSSSRGRVRGLSPHPVKAPRISLAHNRPRSPFLEAGNSRSCCHRPGRAPATAPGPGRGLYPSKFQSRPPAPSRVLGPRGCAKPVPASALHGVYKPLSDLELDVVGTPFLILNARDQPLRLRAAVGPIPGESWSGSVPGHRGRGTGWEPSTWGTSLLLASLSRLLIWKQWWLLPGPWALGAQ